MKLLVVTPEPIDAAALRAAAGDIPEDAEVLVVSPAIEKSGLRFIMSDVDDAIGHAERAAEETATALEEEGVDAVGITGESETALAIQDNLATFAADRVVVFTRGDGHREQEGLAETEQRYGVPFSFHAL